MTPAAMPGSLPVLSCAETAAFEKTFFADPANSAAVFMRRAAAGVADETEKLFAEIRTRKIRSVLVLAGRGNNAADALLAAKILHGRHRCPVRILLAQSPEKMTPPAGDALNSLLADNAQCHVWRGAPAADEFLSREHLVLRQFTEGNDPAGDDFPNDTDDILLDGLLGYNFRPPLRAPFADLIRWANNRADRFKLRVAVDLPSGLGDDAGDTDAVFHADATVACGLVKVPLLQPENAPFRGRLRLAEIGFPDDTAGAVRAGSATRLLARSPLRKPRAPLADKRDLGHLLILGGSRAMPGALLMNVRAALKAGVGLLTVFCPESMHAAFAAAAPEAMWVPFPETPTGSLALEGEFLVREKLPRATALLCGSGMGADAETLALLDGVVAQAARAAVPLILDADALRPEILDAAKSRSGTAPLVLLPHAGEFLRVAGTAPLRAAAEKFAAHIALKGAPTRVADAAREITVCAGGPILARGGSGDLLAGITGALFARRLHDDPLQTLTTAVAWHGIAADHAARQHGAEAVATTDILNHLGPALRE